MLGLKRTSPIAKAWTPGGFFDRLQSLIDNLLAIVVSRA